MMKDMTEGRPAKILFAFAMPMILGNIFQQLYNLVDSIVVGNYVGADALAAVGASYPITFLALAIATGASIGCSVVISQMFGAKRLSDVKTAISTALIAIGILGIIVSIIGFLCGGGFLSLLRTPSDVFHDSLVYLRIYFLGGLFLFLYNTLTASFNALGDSRSPLCFLTISSVLNIALDLLFVIKFNMGVAGVAWATLIAQGVSCVLSVIFLFGRLRRLETPDTPKIFALPVLTQMCRIAVPSIIQQSVVSVGMLMVQGLVNSYGTNVIAGYATAGKIDTFAIMPMINISNAVSTFTAQNIGAGKVERVSKGYHAAWGLQAIISLCITGILLLFGPQLMGIFVDAATNQAVIDIGVSYLRVSSLFYIIMGGMFTTNGLLRGSGDMNIFMVCTICNIGIRILMSYGLSTLIGANALWWSIPIGWASSLCIGYIRYLSGAWKKKSQVSTKEEAMS